jgi:hypothetical protein
MLKHLKWPQRVMFKKTQTGSRVKPSAVVCGECGIYAEPRGESDSRSKGHPSVSNHTGTMFN